MRGGQGADRALARSPVAPPAGAVSVGVRQIGFAPGERGGFYLTLGQQLEVDFVLAPRVEPSRHDPRRQRGGGLEFSKLSAGGQTTCRITLAGATYCWGRNDYGQVGNGSSSYAAVPAPVKVAGRCRVCR